MKELPNTYCVMNSLGITLNDLMIYQEPRISCKGTFTSGFHARTAGGNWSIPKSRTRQTAGKHHAFTA